MYSDIREKLIDLAEEKYRIFSSGLIPNVDNMLGVRIPLLHRLAREIARGDWRAYLSSNDVKYFEETMLQGIVIGYAKADVEEKLRYVAWFVPKINNWEVCDIFCSGLKFVRENRERVWNFLQPYFTFEGEYEVRFGIIMLLQYYVEEDYISRLFRLFDSVRHEGYYARMAVAWAVSMCFAKLPEPTMNYLRQNSLNLFTYNKALQKIIESKQVDQKTKEIIRGMRRKA